MSAYIYEGEDFATVKSHAYAFAKSINCEAGNAGRFCGVCLSCRTFDNGNHPDTFFVRGTKQSGIGVEDIREQLIMPMATEPFKYKYKVFITETPITPQAQNALLKTIEEPAPYGVFLFLAENTGGFLPTILSRCVVKKFRGHAPDQSAAFAPLAAEIATAAQNATIPAAFALYKKIEPIYKENKEHLTQFLDALYIHCGQKRNFAATEAIINTKKILAQNGNVQLAIELMSLKMR